ncbi:class I SAM-dependent methyltransferase [Roseococcus sp.]|uniref:class I SAM-dependent methyltransferase n=1 Tax=Roseococcus sp. TaxID=2109646 RepID=UPI003BAC1D8E
MDLPKPRLSNNALLTRIKQLFWFHSIPLRPGITTPGLKTQAILTAEEAALTSGIDFKGRSVLDIGAWNGYYSFAAKRLGAARVLATDSFCWTHPKFRGRETFELARDELGLDIETRLIDPTEITPELGSFDIVLFLGVFYHLFDPIDVLQRVRSVTSQLLLVETHQDLADRTEPGMIFYPGATLNHDSTNCWGPNPALMRHLLNQLGFARILYRHYPHSAGETMNRGIYACLTPEADPALIAKIGPEWRDLDAPGMIPALAAEIRA